MFLFQFSCGGVVLNSFRELMQHFKISHSDEVKVTVDYYPVSASSADFHLFYIKKLVKRNLFVRWLLNSWFTVPYCRHAHLRVAITLSEFWGPCGVISTINIEER
jgi:hypothetical protein